MDAKTRFKQVRKYAGLTMNAFGEKIGLSASGVSAIECGTRSMNDKHIKLIRAAYPVISEHWLRTGEGDMLLFQNMDQSTDDYLEEFRQDMQDKIDYEKSQRRMLLRIYDRFLNGEGKHKLLAYALDIASVDQYCKEVMACPEDAPPTVVEHNPGSDQTDAGK